MNTKDNEVSDMDLGTSNKSNINSLDMLENDLQTKEIIDVQENQTEDTIEDVSEKPNKNNTNLSINKIITEDTEKYNVDNTTSINTESNTELNKKVNTTDILLVLFDRIEHIKQFYDFKNIDFEINSRSNEHGNEYHIEIFKNSNYNIYFNEVFYINENKDISILITEAINYLDKIIEGSPNKLPVIQNETNYYKKMKVQSFNNIMRNRFIMSDDEIRELTEDIYANKINEPSLSDEVRRLKRELNIAKAEILSNYEKKNIFKTIIVMLVITTMIFHPEIIEWYSNQIVQFQKLIKENTMYRTEDYPLSSDDRRSYINPQSQVNDNSGRYTNTDEGVNDNRRSYIIPPSQVSTKRIQHDNTHSYNVNTTRSTRTPSNDMPSDNITHNNTPSDDITHDDITHDDKRPSVSSTPIEIGYADVNKTEYEKTNEENMQKWKEGESFKL